MKWKISQKLRPRKIETRIVFFPRYCSKCLTAYWLERLPFYDDKFLCPTGDNGFMWTSKKDALKYHKD